MYVLRKQKRNLAPGSFRPCPFVVTQCYNLYMEEAKNFYHGSPNSDLEELEPRPVSFLEDKQELLFACPDIAGATLFLTRIYDDISKKGYSHDGYYIVIGDKEKFLEMDKGGTVYVLPDASFTTDERFWGREWGSKEKLKPIHKIHFGSSLRAMIENGVKVYFTDPETFEQKIKGKQTGIKYLEEELGLKQEE
jgi:hypothetical protein